ncbi:MAG: hypothetical protein IT431_10620 [Phycisphaerales bacterium]|nr:hypothetical protein [Phycisphaerales bacterium]
MSASDHSLLTALFTPSTDLLSTAAAHNLSLLDLAHWLAQPHIQAQVDAIHSLRALQHHIWADQLRHEAAEALRGPMKEAADPAERRRCATTLLRAISLPPVPRAPRRVPLAARPPVLGAPALPAHPDLSIPHSPAADLAESPRPERGPGVAEPEAQASATPPLGASMPECLDAFPSVTSSYHQTLASLRALGYDIPTDAELDAEIDADADDDFEDDLDGDDLDALEDAELDNYAANLTDAEAIALAEHLVEQHLANRPTNPHPNPNPNPQPNPQLNPHPSHLDTS